MPTPQAYAGQNGPIRPMNGVVPGMTWAQFIAAIGSANDLNTISPNGPNAAYMIPGLGLVGATRTANMGSGGGESGSGMGDGGFGPTYSGPFGSYTQNVGDGTQNSFTQDENGNVLSHNDTINDDSWWDSTGWPLVMSLAFGGATAGLAAGGIGAAGGAAGEGLAAGATGAFDMGGSVGAGLGTAGDAALGSTGSLAGGFSADPGSPLYDPWSPNNWSAATTGETASDATGSWVQGADGVFRGTEPIMVSGGGAAAGGGGSLLSSLIPYGVGAAGAALPMLGNMMQPTGSTNDVPVEDRSQPDPGSPNTVNGVPVSQLTNVLKTLGGLGSSLFGGSGATTNGAGGALSNPSLLNGLLQGVGGALSANEAKDLGNQIIKTVDPFHDYRGQYAQALNGLVQQPTYGSQFQPTALNNYVANNNPLSSPTLANLQNFTHNPDVANSFNTLNGATAANAGTYGALNGVGDQYAALLKDPNAIFQDTAYKAQLAQGTDTLNRSLAARGMTNSGNEQQALQDYGQANAATYYSNRLNQLGTGYNQNLSATQNQFAQNQSIAASNLARDQANYSELNNTNNATLQANQLGYNENAGAFQSNLLGNQQQYSQLAQMSGLSQANLGAAGNALAQTYSNVGSAYNNVGSGIGQILNASGGLGGLLNTLGNGGTSLFNSLSNLFGGGTSQTAPILPSNPYGFPTDPSGNLVFDE